MNIYLHLFFYSLDGLVGIFEDVEVEFGEDEGDVPDIPVSLSEFN